MSKTKPKRTKKYGGPKRRSADTIGEAITGIALYEPAQIAALQKRSEAAYVLLREGRAQNHDWNEITQALSVAQKLCDLNIGNNLRPDIEAGLTALSQVAVRMLKKDGPTACYAEELKAIREALDMRAAQLKVCSQNEYRTATRYVTAFLKSIPEGTIDDYMRRCERERLAGREVSVHV